MSCPALSSLPAHKRFRPTSSTRRHFYTIGAGFDQREIHNAGPPTPSGAGGPQILTPCRAKYPCVSAQLSSGLLSLARLLGGLLLSPRALLHRDLLLAGLLRRLARRAFGGLGRGARLLLRRRLPGLSLRGSLLGGSLLGSLGRSLGSRLLGSSRLCCRRFR